jgi:uncharacterized membrane protein
MRILLLISVVIIFIALGTGIFLSSSLPDEMPSHWNLQGDVDGFMPKMFGICFLPILALVIMGLMVVIPGYDPAHRRYVDFQQAYDGLILLIVVFLIVLYLNTLLWALGIHIPMNSLMSVMFALLFVGLGIFFHSVRRTWFVGIRTPWTILSEHVWKETHRVGSWVFIGIGILCLGGIPFPSYAYIFVFVPLLFGIVSLVSYSYLVYNRENAELLVKKSKSE